MAADTFSLATTGLNADSPFTPQPITLGDSGSGAWVGEEVLGLLVARLSTDHSLGRVEYAPEAGVR